MAVKIGPFIIVEGADGSGKTTLGQHLASHGLRYAHASAPTRPTRRYNLDLVYATGSGVIDRLHPSSFVYQTAFEGVDPLSQFDHWLLDGVMMSALTATVYCRPSDEALDAVLARPSRDAGEDAEYEAVERRAQVRHLYDIYFDQYGQLPHWRYDYTQADAFEAIVAQCLLWHDTMGRWQHPLEEVPTLGNTVSPRYVLVSDEPRIATRLRERALARGWDPKRYIDRFSRLHGRLEVFDSPSGHYLWRALTAAPLRLGDVLVVNARQLDGTRLAALLGEGIPDEWRAAEWVALGKRADEELTVLGLPHRAVPHPQFVRRFHHKELARYARAITGVELW